MATGRSPPWRRRRAGLAAGLLHREGIDDADGDIWLHCYPRVLGYTFKPVSFGTATAPMARCAPSWSRSTTPLASATAYLLEDPAPGATLTARKVFHVSPFVRCGNYAFRFQTRGTGDGPPRSRSTLI